MLSWIAANRIRLATAVVAALVAANGVLGLVPDGTLNTVLLIAGALGINVAHSSSLDAHERIDASESTVPFRR